MREAKSDGEACFLIAEVALALRRVHIPLEGGGLDVNEVSQQMAAVQTEIAEMANRKLQDGGSVPPQLAKYVCAALEETTA